MAELLTIFNNKLIAAVVVIGVAGLSLSQRLSAETISYHYDGHIKGRIISLNYPHNSVFNSLTGTHSLDMESDLRLNLEANMGPWSAQAGYQLFTAYGDRIEYSRQLPNLNALAFERLPNDTRRFFNLTEVIEDDKKSAALHRLDRLWLSYSGHKSIIRFGRQAISWGNGFFFSPMDIINPFDPTTIDTEYKSGDDMLYGQYLKDNGDDVQGAIVFRRNANNDKVESDESTFSIKYHGIIGDREFDLLVADSYGNLNVGIGGSHSVAGAVWRGDLMITDTEISKQIQLVTNLGYSWTWHGKNMSGVVEYYYNGFGQNAGDYSPRSIASNLDLVQGLSRGELFSVGKHYLSAGVTVEMTPLWTLAPNLFGNLRDGSALLQVVTQHNLSDNLTFLGALNIPMGADGTEYGGIETDTPGQFLSNKFKLFAQLAWYF